MKISAIIQVLEQWASPDLQESYDNVGLIVGSAAWDCTGVICSLDATEAVILEAKAKGCNLVVAHHPIVFSGIKKLNGKNYVEQTIIAAIKHDVAIYAIHTNLDNVQHGVNKRIADTLGLQQTHILDPKKGQLCKLFTFVPIAHAEKVRTALFAAGAGHIGNYAETSFSVSGIGTFKANEAATPFVGTPGARHEEPEMKIEMVFPAWLQKTVVAALLAAHPYEEVAYDIVQLVNGLQQVGSGMVGLLPEPMEEMMFLNHLAAAFGLKVIRHTPLLGKKIQKVAVCGGSGSFLVGKAAAVGADILISADIKYHEFFDANHQLVIADIGHWESEQFTTDLLLEFLQLKFPTFAVLKSTVHTNPIQYFVV